MCITYLWRLCFGRSETPDSRGLTAPQREFRRRIRSYQMEEMGEKARDAKDWANSDVIPDEIPDKDVTVVHKNTTNKTAQQFEAELLKMKKYKLDAMIGKGGHAIVYMTYTTDDSGYPEVKDGQELACKVMDLSADGQFGVRDAKRMHAFKSELYALVKSNHRNIVAIKDHFIINDKCYLMMEYADMGSLESYRRRLNDRFTEEEAKRLFGHIASGIFYLHCNLGFAHLDIKLGNILLFTDRKLKDNKDNEKIKNLICKVSDFGLSRLRIDPKDGIIKEWNPKGTVPYMSPQVLHLYIQEKLNERSIYGETRPFNPFIADIWSMGVCLYLMLFNEYPFDCEDDPRLMINVLEDMKRKRYKTDFQSDSDRLKSACRDILEDCIEPNPHKRLTIHNIVTHVWFDGMFTVEDLATPKVQSSHLC